MNNDLMFWISTRRGDLIAEWEYIGEGLCGDYNPDDPDDVKLLRFTVKQFHITSDWGGQWRELDDGSYCTQMPLDTDEWILKRALELILDAADQPSPKRALEELSWMKPEDFK